MRKRHILWVIAITASFPMWPDGCRTKLEILGLQDTNIQDKSQSSPTKTSTGHLIGLIRQGVDGPTNTCGASEEDVDDLGGENVDTTSTEPQPQEGTTHTQGEKLPPGPKDLSQLPDSGPACPDLKRYSAIEYSGLSRSFNKNWRDQHSWLEYSVTQDAAFCFACRLFSHTHLSKTEKFFTHEGFWNWKKVTTSLKSHDNSAGYKFAMQAWAEFKLQKTKGARIQHALDALMSLQDEFLDFTAAEGLDTDSLLKKIIETLAKCGIDHNACIGQCYDGVAVMSGHISGAQERFRREVSTAMHTVVHEEFLKVQKELELVNQHIELKRLSDTRWACQHAACLAVKTTLPAITVHQGGQRSAPRHLDEFIITSSTGQRDEPTTDARKHTFYAIIDRMLNKLNRRFFSDACSVLMGATALNPKHSTFLDKQTLLGIAANYGVAEDDLAVEVHQLNQLIARKKDKGQEILDDSQNPTDGVTST
ncbi:uncharacterized protein LOC143257723 [Tachypleus tridentatus]|uniref:uncharacterized protein LOC143257723 n=1 Tax=Tachypleus tridentatus TaxID=6853 RepID=UPI003FD427E7